MGTNCVDNGTREGLDKFLKTASNSPETALHYEFMQVCFVNLHTSNLHVVLEGYFAENEY